MQWDFTRALHIGISTSLLYWKFLDWHMHIKALIKAGISYSSSQLQDLCSSHSTDLSRNPSNYQLESSRCTQIQVQAIGRQNHRFQKNKDLSQLTKWIPVSCKLFPFHFNLNLYLQCCIYYSVWDRNRKCIWKIPSNSSETNQLIPAYHRAVQDCAFEFTEHRKIQIMFKLFLFVDYKLTFSKTVLQPGGLTISYYAALF